MADEQIVVKESNEDRRRARLERTREKNHNWRVSTWARAQIKIAECDAELRALGFEPTPLYEADFDDVSMLPEYAARTSSAE